MPAKLIIPTNYRDIVRLAHKHGVKLTPGTLLPMRENRLCYLSLLAFVNGFGYYHDFKYKFGGKMNSPVRSIEAGFENWSPEDRNPRYYRIGQRLRKDFDSYVNSTP